MLYRKRADGQTAMLGVDDVRAMSDAELQRLVTQLFRPGGINLQRYFADEGGYPYWHSEISPKVDSDDNLHRVLLWTIYLNDAFDEGETEFLYQQRRIVPRTGSLLLAPAGFTHTHRGNKPKNGNKYIATSWVLFQRAADSCTPIRPRRAEPRARRRVPQNMVKVETITFQETPRWPRVRSSRRRCWRH